MQLRTPHTCGHSQTSLSSLPSPHCRGSWSGPRPGGRPLARLVSRKAVRRRRSARCAAASGEDDRDKPPDATQLAPVQPKTPLGEMASYYLRMEPDLFTVTVEEQFKRIQAEREKEEEARRQAEAEAADKQKDAKPSDKRELVLYKRMAELKESEARMTLEDLMYASVLNKFRELGVGMMPRLENLHADDSATLQALTQGVHTTEALTMVKDHVRGIMGRAAMAFPNSTIKMSKLQAAQVYAASIMFGYFVRRVDKRFQLERSLGLLDKEGKPDKEEAVARLERLFNRADSIDEADEVQDAKDYPQGDENSPRVSGGPGGGPGDAQFAQNQGRPKEDSPLRRYVESFDQSTMMDMARVLSAEGAALVEAQVKGLFGDLQALQRQMQEAVGADASSLEELMQRVQQAVAQQQVEVLNVTVATQRRSVLEAVAFGTFLRDVEAHVDSEYGLLTAAARPRFRPGGDIGPGGFAGDRA